MRRLTSIVALNREGAIGVGNSLPWRVRSDLRFFRQTTFGHVVIMGRKTFDSLGHRGLPGRKNVIVTHGFGMVHQQADCWTAGSIDEALVQAAKLATKRQQVFVVGGASMYEQFSSFVDRYLITIVDKKVPDADTFFSEEVIGNESNWSLSTVADGKADGLNDEADYQILQLDARDEQTAYLRRQKVLNDAISRQTNNRLATVPQRLAAAG